MIDYKALQTEILTDAKGLGYAPRVAVGDDEGIAALLNTTTGPGSVTLPLTARRRQDFLALTTPAVIRLAIGIGTAGQPLDATVRAKWAAVLEHSRASDPGSMIDLTLMGMVGDPVSEKVLTADELAALKGSQTLSRAQSLFSDPTLIVLHQDVAVALRDTK